jgi:hypothetical protein
MTDLPEYSNNPQSKQWIHQCVNRDSILNCELYDEARDELRRRVGVHGMRTSMLLGDKNIIRNTLEYIEKIGRFSLNEDN